MRVWRRTCCASTMSTTPSTPASPTSVSSTCKACSRHCLRRYASVRRRPRRCQVTQRPRPRPRMEARARRRLAPTRSATCSSTRQRAGSTRPSCARSSKRRFWRHSRRRCAPRRWVGRRSAWTTSSSEIFSSRSEIITMPSPWSNGWRMHSCCRSSPNASSRRPRSSSSGSWAARVLTTLASSLKTATARCSMGRCVLCSP